MPQAVIWRGTTALVEVPTSPQWNLGERIVALVTYKGPHATCLASAPSRGTAGSGSYAGLFVAESEVQRERGSVGVLVIKYEGAPEEGGPGGGVTVPVDECEIDFVDQQFDLRKHPYFSGLSASQRDAVESALQSTTDTARQESQNKVALNATAQKLLDKLRNGETNFYLPFPIYVRTIYSLTQPSCTVGGFIQTPSGPITPPTGYDWIRKSDKLRFTGTYWALTRTWQAGLDIDPDLY